MTSRGLNDDGGCINRYGIIASKSIADPIYTQKDSNINKRLRNPGFGYLTPKPFPFYNGG